MSRFYSKGVFLGLEKPQSGDQCDTFDLEFNPRLCLIKHYAAKKRQVSGKAGYEPCAYCELVLKHIAQSGSEHNAEVGKMIETNQEENNQMGKKDICQGCGRKMVIKADGRCGSCYNKNSNQPKPEAILPQNGKVGVCIECGKEKKIKTAGKCGACYNRPHLKAYAERKKTKQKIAPAKAAIPTFPPAVDIPPVQIRPKTTAGQAGEQPVRPNTIRIINTLDLEMINKTTRALLEVNQEIAVARQNHPDTKELFVALVEEVGEVARALQEDGDIYGESKQVACLAIRIMTELTSPREVVA